MSLGAPLESATPQPAFPRLGHRSLPLESKTSVTPPDLGDKNTGHARFSPFLSHEFGGDIGSWTPATLPDLVQAGLGNGCFKHGPWYLESKWLQSRRTSRSTRDMSELGPAA